MKKIFFLFVLIFFFSNAFFSQEISNQMLTFLQNNGFSATTQSLVSGGENLFAYNIIIKIPSLKENKSENTKVNPQKVQNDFFINSLDDANNTTTNFILIFNQEDFFSNKNLDKFSNKKLDNKSDTTEFSEQNAFLENQNLIKNVIRQIQTKNYDFNTYFLFTYGEKQTPEKQGMIYGTQIFIDSLNSNEDSTVLLFNLNEQKNHIFTNSNGITAPSYLIQNEFNILAANGLKKAVPSFYISQLFRLSVFEDTQLDSFFQNNIPAVKIDFSPAQIQNQNQSDNNVYVTIENIILQSIEKFAQTNQEQRIWEHHFFMINFFGRYINLSEKTTVKIIITLVFLWIIFLLFFIFINQNKKKYDWQRLKKIWYVVPLTFLLILFSLWAGRWIFSHFSRSYSDIAKIFGLFCTQLILTFLVCSVTFNILLYFNPYFEEHSIDFLITICCFINQSLFILIDISLFPIFMFICLLSILALICKNNKLHICIFIVMALSFQPYFNLLTQQSDALLLRQFCFSNNKILIFLTLILYPVFIVYFRILTSFKRRIIKTSNHIIAVSSIFLLLAASTTAFTFFSTNKIKKQTIPKPKYILKSSDKNTITISYSDKSVFGDTIRTLFIETDSSPLQCDVSIQTENNTPILYSDSDFVRSAKNSVYFKIPNLPPKQLKFVYCSSDEPCRIIVTAIFETEDENIFNLVTKSVIINE